MSETDTRYFDTEFTGESVELTPPEEGNGPGGGPGEFSAIAEVDESTFSQFSYQDPGSVMTTASGVSGGAVAASAATAAAMAGGGSVHSRTSLPLHSE